MPEGSGLYLCAIKDVWSHRIVGYSIDSRMKSRLAVAALDNAAARRAGLAGCILHTDRGSQGSCLPERPRARRDTRRRREGGVFPTPTGICEMSAQNRV